MGKEKFCKYLANLIMELAGTGHSGNTSKTVPPLRVDFCLLDLPHLCTEQKDNKHMLWLC